MGCLPLAVTTLFCFPGVPKQCATTAPSSQLERHLMVFCVDEIVPGYVAYLVNCPPKIIRNQLLSIFFGWRSVMTAASCCAPSTSSREQPVPSISSLPIVHDPQPDLPNQTRSSISRPRVFLGDGRNSFITFLPLCHMVIAWQYPLLPEIQILPLLFYTSHFLPGGIHRNRTIKILCEVQIIG